MKPARRRRRWSEPRPACGAAASFPFPFSPQAASTSISSTSTKRRRIHLHVLPPPLLHHNHLLLLPYTLLLLLLLFSTTVTTTVFVSAAPACDTTLLAQTAATMLRSHYNAAQGWTAPSAPGGAVAPYLSSTDSLFAAYAYSHFDPDQGMKELLANLDGQWASNGMIPRMRFPPESEGAKNPWVAGTFYPGPSQWKGTPRDASNAGLTTAGIAAPPWHAFVAMQLYNARRDDAGLQFLEDVFPLIYAYHLYLHKNRDAGDHLVFCYHPWESELPTDSPVWAEVLKETQARIAAEKWVPAVDYVEPAAIKGYPGEEVFNAEMYLVDLLGTSGYDDGKIQQNTPFLSVDVEFNSILAASDVALAAMAKVLQLHSSSVVTDTKRSFATSWLDSSATRLNQYLWAGDRYASYLVTPRAQPTLKEGAPPTAVPAPPVATPKGAGAQGVGVVGAEPPGLAAPAARKQKLTTDIAGTGAGEGGKGQRQHPHHRQTQGKKPLKVTIPAPGSSSASAPPPPVPLPPGNFFPLNVISNFAPLYVGKLPAPFVDRFEGLLFQIITPGIETSFDCQGDMYRLPTSGCEVKDPNPKISLMHNLVVQRGLAANGDVGFNQWLKNETLNLICDGSMNPFAPAPSTATNKDAAPFRFARYFDPVTGKPLEDMFGAEATMAAALVWVLLKDDAVNGAETPPISHDVTFALVVVELVIAFATGVGCFLFSLSLFRRLSRADAEDVGPVSSMLNVRDEEEEEEEEDEYEEEEGDYDRGGGGGVEEEEEVEEEKGAVVGLQQRKRHNGKKGRAGGGGSGPGVGGGNVGRSLSRGFYQTFSRGGGSGGVANNSRAAVGGPGAAGSGERRNDMRRSESEMSTGTSVGSEEGGGVGSVIGRVGGALRSGVEFLKFW